MKRLYILLMICAAWLPLKAQVVDVSIQILPPYPTKITDYASRPQLMVIAVRNISRTAQKVQLRGAVTGDNGIELRVRNNYKSINAIPLAPGEVRMLNGNDLKYFFDYTKIDYKGITQNDFINKNGLPEGTYRFCIRAYDYDTNTPLSNDEPVGCSNSFTIKSLEPPTIIAPMADANVTAVSGQTVLFQWSTPPGTSPQIMSAVRYKLRMVEIIGNRNPNNALMSATTPYFFEKEVMGNSYVYNAADPQLTPGRKYAFMVEAYDPFNHTPFRNNGRSEVRSFTYTSPPTFVNMVPPNLPPLTPTPAPGQQHTIMGAVSPGPGNTPNCSCKAAAGVATSDNASLQANVSIVSVGDFKMHITAITPGANGMVNGEGTMELPFTGGIEGARLRVTFSDLDVGTDLKMKSGSVQGVVSQDAPSFIPKVNGPNTPDLTMQPGDATNLEQYFTTHAWQMLTNVKSAGKGAGFELPLGLSKGPVTVAMTRINFSATQAWFEAGAAVDIPDGGADNVLALTGKNICINAAENFCKDGTLYLSQDFKISALHMVLKAPVDANDAGTSITFDKNGFKQLNIKAEYTFNNGTLMDASTNQGLVATLSGTSKPGSGNGWSDWLATVSMPKFYIGGMKTITFDLAGKAMYYDHSDFQKPDGIPDSFSPPDGDGEAINTAAYTWMGFYIPSITVNLPQIIKSTASGDGRVSITGSKLIIDANGFTGIIHNTSSPILAVGDGSMDGWYASIDNVNLQFFRSAFKQSSMTGKLVLPASKRENVQNQLDYSASLTTPSGNGIAYNFKIYPKSGLTFDAMFMTVQLDSTSNITVHGDTNTPLVASATLNGALSLANDKIGIPHMGKLSLPHIEFTNLKFMTQSPFIDKNGMEIKLSNTPHTTNGGGTGQNSGFDYIPDWEPFGGPNAASLNEEYPSKARVFAPADDSDSNVAGFDFTLASSGFALDFPDANSADVGWGFKGGLSLVAGPIQCQADADFTLSSKIVKDPQTGRIGWGGIGGKINSIDFAGAADLGPFKIKGAVMYYNKPDDEGFIGALETDLAGFLTLTMRGQFGTKADAQGKFKYFNFNAMADFGQTGITFAPAPFALYGFGGGIYYNMTQSKESLPDPSKFPVAQRGVDKDDVPKTAAAPADPKQPKDNTEALALLNYNPANITLTPQRGSWGLQATVLFGLTSRNTLDVDATFTMQLREGGGLEYIALDGNARLLTDVSKPLSERNKVSTGIGSLHINYNTVDKSFLAQLKAELGVPYSSDTSIFHAKGGGEFSYSPQGWYLKIGRPEGYGEGPNKVTLLDFISGTSYFEVGSTGIDPMPGVPKAIRDLVGYGPNDQQDKLQKTQSGSRHYTASGTGEHGLILGAAVEIGHKDKEYHFLMFYGQLNAQMGFDISLTSGKKCDGFPGAGGPGGWYAQGQAYMGAHALLGIDVNLFLIHGKFTIFDAGAAAVLRAGLPNPVWAQGTIGGHFSILDGAISSDFHFGFSIGDECVDSNADAFGGLELISQVSPGENSTDKQPLSTMPGVTFNVKAGGQFKNSSYLNGRFEFDDYEHTSKTGNPTKRYFLFDNTCITAKLNGNVINKDLVRLDNQGFALGYQMNTYLDKNTQYTFRVEAKMHEGFVFPGMTEPYFDYDSFIKQTDNKNADAMQYKETIFTTDDGFSTIPSSEYARTAPLHSDRSVIPTEYGATGNQWYLETKRVIDNEKFFKYPAGTTYKARIFRNGNKEGNDIDVNMSVAHNQLNDGVYRTTSPGSPVSTGQDDHSKWVFTGPMLQTSSDYTVLIIATIPKGANNDNATGSVINKQLYTGVTSTGKLTTSNVSINALQRTVSNHLNTLSAGEAIAGGFAFHTSAYNTYLDKFAGMQITNIFHKTALNSTISPKRMIAQNLQTIRQWKLDTVQKDHFQIVLGSGLGGFNFPAQVTFSGESFSKADLNSTKSDDIFQADYSNYGGVRRNISIPALYNKNPVEDFGADFIKLRTFLSANTSVPLSNITVKSVSAGKSEDKGWYYCTLQGGDDVEYIGNQSQIGATLPTELPQSKSGNNNSSMQIAGGFIPMLPGLTLASPVLLNDLNAVNQMCVLRGQMTFTDPIQKQIDKVKNWAVNPGDNMASPGNVTTNSMSNVAVWENVSATTTGYIGGSLNQNQLQGAVQGAMNKAGALR